MYFDGVLVLRKDKPRNLTKAKVKKSLLHSQKHASNALEQIAVTGSNADFGYACVYR